MFKWQCLTDVILHSQKLPGETCQPREWRCTIVAPPRGRQVVLCQIQTEKTKTNKTTNNKPSGGTQPSRLISRGDLMAARWLSFNFGPGQVGASLAEAIEEGDLERGEREKGAELDRPVVRQRTESLVKLVSQQGRGKHSGLCCHAPHGHWPGGHHFTDWQVELGYILA